MSLRQESQRYTYADYLAWDENERIEIIEGVPVMQAAPSISHQRASREIFGQLYNFLKGKHCEVFSAPFAVRLDAKGDDSDDSVLEPDIVVICDSLKLDEKGCKGAPDMVVEVLSPSTARTDRVIKFQKYLLAGVREYWIVDTDTKSVQACVLNGGLYFTTMYTDTETAPVKVLDGCHINLQDVFSR